MSGLEPFILGLFGAGGAAGAGAAGAAGTGLTVGQTLGLVGTGVSVAGTIAGGVQAANAADYQEKVAEQNEDEAHAASQREAEARRRQGRLIQSRQRAAIAAGGGSIAEPSVLDVMGDTAQAVDLAADTDIYRGENAARGYRDAANVARYQKGQALGASYLGAASDLFSGVSNMYARFGQQHRKTASASSVLVPYG